VRKDIWNRTLFSGQIGRSGDNHTSGPVQPAPDISLVISFSLILLQPSHYPHIHWLKPCSSQVDNVCVGFTILDIFDVLSHGTWFDLWVGICFKKIGTPSLLQDWDSMYGSSLITVGYKIIIRQWW
jgi:hypothetical protein